MRSRLSVPVAAALVVGLPAAAGALVSLVRILGSPYPDLEWAVGVNTDAAAIYLGDWPFQDPAEGYTGHIYTPLFPLVVAGLHHIGWWAGWPLVMALLSSLGLAAIAGRLAWRPGRSRVEAFGVGMLAWSLVLGVEVNAVFEGRADQFAWLLALGGLLLAPSDGRGARIASPLLVAAGFWAKQSTIVVAAPVALWMLWRRAGLRRAASWWAPLGLGTLGVFGGLELATGGWQGFFNVTLADRLALITPVGDAARELAEDMALGALLAAAAWGLVLRGRGAGRVDDRVVLLVLLLPVAAAGAIWTRRVIAGADNHFVGVAWTLGLLLALAWREAPPLRAGLALVAAAAVLLPGTSALSLRGGELVPVIAFEEVPEEVRRFAERHDVYNQNFSDISVPGHRVVHQHYQALEDLLWGGIQPRFMLDRLLRRGYEVVYWFDPRPDTSGAGRHEANWFWKADQVLLRKYRRSAATPLMDVEYGRPPQRGFVPRRGPDPAPWIDHCFAPLPAGAATFRIRDGGGLWCTEPGRPGRLRMRGSPAAVTEVVAERQARRVSGAMTVRLPRRGGFWRIDLGNARLGARVVDGGRGIEVVGRDGGRVTMRSFVAAAALRRSGGTIRVRFGGAGGPARAGGTPVVVAAPLEGGGELRLTTSGNSDARFDLTSLRIAY